MNRDKIIIIIAGPNEAGKTTFAREFLPRHGMTESLNADLIAAGLSPLRPEASAIAAGCLLLRLWKNHAEKGTSFAFESTLSGHTYAAMLRKAKSDGYIIAIHYLWVPSVQICLRRVRNRVRKGGHHVPDEDVRRRHPLSLRNLLGTYLPLADSAELWDVSGSPPCLVTSWQDQVSTIHHPERHALIQAQNSRNQG
ncbi:MAG: AAA family ATPase [Verrucomicrobiales bacterium]